MVSRYKAGFSIPVTSIPAINISAILVAIATLITACTTVSTTEDTASAPISNPAIASSKAVATTAIEIDGSSTVYPITDAAAKAFRQTQPNVQIDVQFSGTTGGFRKFCAGETDISNASRPISTEEMASCRQIGVPYIELPIAFDALTIVVHPQNTWANELTVEELKRVWQSAAQGKITNWNQVRSTFPNKPLTLYGAGKDSGTYDYFAETIVGDKSTRSDYTASEDDNVLVQAVSRDPNALGYFGFAYYEANQSNLKALWIDNGKGSVMPSRQAVEKATYQPLSRPLFLYVNAQAAQKNPALRDFVQFYLKNGQQIVTSIQYIPLPEAAYEINQVHLYKGKVGTVFAGKPQPNLTIQEVLQKEESF